MIDNGSLVGRYVKIKDNYAGNIVDVVGKTAKVLARRGDNLALDLKGYKKNQDHRYWDYDVIVNTGEIEVVEFDFKDSNGQKVEIGDKVVYGPLGGGVTVGIVVDIKEAEHSRWGRGYKTTKVQLEVESEKFYGDGDREVRLPSTTKRWYDHGSRMLVIQKGAFTGNRSWSNVIGNSDFGLE
jgi:hypothetical protein